MPSWFQKIGCQGELFPVDQHRDFTNVLFLLISPFPHVVSLVSLDSENFGSVGSSVQPSFVD